MPPTPVTTATKPFQPVELKFTTSGKACTGKLYGNTVCDIKYDNGARLEDNLDAVTLGRDVAVAILKSVEKNPECGIRSPYVPFESAARIGKRRIPTTLEIKLSTYVLFLLDLDAPVCNICEAKGTKRKAEGNGFCPSGKVVRGLGGTDPDLLVVGRRWRCRYGAWLSMHFRCTGLAQCMLSHHALACPSLACQVDGNVQHCSLQVIPYTKHKQISDIAFLHA